MPFVAQMSPAGAIFCLAGGNKFQEAGEASSFVQLPLGT